MTQTLKVIHSSPEETVVYFAPDLFGLLEIELALEVIHTFQKLFTWRKFRE